MVSDALVEEIRERADLVEVVGEHVSLKRVGKSWRGPCPLHGGDGPNFSVDPERGIFKCFVCGEGGDVFGFLMKHLGLDFPSAVRRVGARVGIEVPDRAEPREDPHASLREVLAFAAEWFRERLLAPEGEPARAYLEGRGVSMEAAERYGLGYAPDAWRGLRDAARERGIEEPRLLELGLLATSERAEEPYDRFRGRLIFTIQDLRDRPIGFGGRLLESTREALPRYINSPDSPVFHKGDELYGLNWARHAIRREGRAAIVEGYTDVLGMHLAELPVAVAGLGTAFTRRQAERLARYADRALLLYDSDPPGLRATFKTADLLLAAGVHPLVVTLPRGEDPDSLIRSGGPGVLREHLEDAIDVLERKLQILERGGFLETIEGRRRAVDGVLATLRAVRDPALRDIYLDRAGKRLGVQRSTLVREIARSDRRRVGRAADRGRREPPSEPARPADKAERELALLLVRDPTLAERASRAGLRAEHFEDPHFRAIFRHLAGPAGESRADPWTEDAWEELPPGARSAVERLMADATELGSPEEIFEAGVRRLLYRRHRERLREIDRELEIADPEHQRELLIEKQRVAEELRRAGEMAAFMPRRGRGVPPEPAETGEPR